MTKAVFFFAAWQNSVCLDHSTITREYQDVVFASDALQT